jgi:hypothetical protein
MSTTFVAFVVAAVFAVLYVMRRRGRLSREDND